MEKNVKIWIGIASGIVILFLFGGLLRYGSDFLENKTQIITKADLSLSPGVRQLYEKRLEDAKKLIAEIRDDTSTQEKIDRYMAAANAEFSLGNYGESKKWYLKIFDIDDKLDNIWYSYSTLLAAMNDHQSAMEAITKALSLNQANPDYWLWKISLMKRQSYNQNDINGQYILALQKTLDNIDIITSYAKFLEETGNLQAAKEYWQKAIEKNPNNKATYEAEIRRIDVMIRQRQ